MCKKEKKKRKKISHSNKSNRINDSVYDASVINTENDFRRFMKVRNINKTQKEIQMENGDSSDTFYQFTKSLCEFIFGCGSVVMLNQVKFL